MADDEETYIDEKGRVRWRVNDRVGEYLKDLQGFLVIGGYDETHAARYPRLAYSISRHPESVETLHRQGRLRELDGVGETIAGIIGQFLDTGTSDKWEGWAKDTPPSVVELTRIPGMGIKTAKMLYQEHGIDSLGSLRQALEDGRLEGVPGIGPKTIEHVNEKISEGTSRR